MSAQNFIEYYKSIEKCEVILHFKRFIQTYCCDCVIKPAQVETKIAFDFSKAKDLFITNLCLNESFYNHDYYFTEDFYDLYKMLTEKNLTKTNLAQIILLVLLSKENLDFYFFENYLLEIKRFELTNPSPFDNLIELFVTLKSNKIIKDKILDISKKITRLNTINFEFDQIEISFFKFPDENLHGFAGINRIYVAYKPLALLYKELRNNRNKQDTDLILKLEFIRLFIHLAVHSVLIFVKNDLNFPNTKSEYYKQYWSIDSGLLIEHEFFKAQINWFDNLDIDLEIWRIFYEQLIFEEFVNFDVSITGVKYKKEIKSILGIDYFSFKV